jgi:RNA polymerase sigma-70 factor (ECF subfamily)
VGTQRLDFAEFYRQSKDDCLRTVLVSVGDLDTAQDLVDEAFARACASWRTVSEHPAPVAWVIRVALNVHVSWWRRYRREVSVPDPGMVAEPLMISGAADSPVDSRIMAALIRLPARQRQVVALRLFLDLDTGHTAKVLGIAPSNATPSNTGSASSPFSLPAPLPSKATNTSGIRHQAPREPSAAAQPDAPSLTRCPAYASIRA